MANEGLDSREKRLWRMDKTPMIFSFLLIFSFYLKIPVDHFIPGIFSIFFSKKYQVNLFTGPIPGKPWRVWHVDFGVKVFAYFRGNNFKDFQIKSLIWNHLADCKWTANVIRNWASKNIKNVPFDRLVKWLTKYKMYLCLIPTWFRLRNWSSLQICHKLSHSRDGWKTKFKSWILSKFKRSKNFEILVPNFHRKEPQNVTKTSLRLTCNDLEWPFWKFYDEILIM